MTYRGSRAAAAVVLACLLGACGAEEPAPSSPGLPAATAVPPPTSPDTAPRPTPSGLVDDDTGEVITPRAVPQWDTEAVDSAADAAEAVMRAFARPDLDYESWWAELMPLLGEEAQLDYAYVDPANVPARQVTGEPVVVQDDSPHIARVQVPTDVGDYTVLLSRRDAGGPWLAHRITPPEAMD